MKAKKTTLTTTARTTRTKAVTDPLPLFTTTTAIALSVEERLLVALYRTVSGSTQRVIRFILFDEWTNPLPQEKEEATRRFSAQIHSPLLHRLDTSAFDTFSNAGGA